MAVLDQGIRTLNFVCVGQVRSGVAVMQSSICGHPLAVCHRDLFHEDKKIRKELHESYYGKTRPPSRKPERPEIEDKLPEYFEPAVISPFQYVRHTIFDNPLHGEQKIGFSVLYPQIVQWEMWDLFEQSWREGDFCMIHVRRNPVACMVSLKQAEQTNVWQKTWRQQAKGKKKEVSPGDWPSPVTLDPEELTAFVRNHDATYRKIKAACPDAWEVSYSDLLSDYNRTMQTIFQFLALDDDVTVTPSILRLRNRPMQRRICNMSELAVKCPSDVKSYLTRDLV